MSSLITKTIEPQTGTTVTLGAAGDTVDIAASQLKTNTVKDAGGNTLFTSDGAGTLSSVNSSLSGSMVFISSQIVTSSSASVSFTSGIDSTYDEYVFVYIDIHPSAEANFRFQADTSAGSSYATTMTTTNYSAYQTVGTPPPTVSWQGGSSVQAQGTSFQPLTEGISSDSDHSGSGILHVFNPASTTYVKNFYSKSQMTAGWHGAVTTQVVAGYFNTTAALSKFQFKLNTGTIDAGTFYLYGIN